VQEEIIIKLSSEDLDDRTDHLSNLVVEEGLTFQEEVDELDGLGIGLISDFKSISINVHIVISR
jgi:hypothetical protein